MFGFACPFCGWEGSQPTTDAHSNAFCPECERPVQMKGPAKKKRND